MNDETTDQNPPYESDQSCPLPSDSLAPEQTGTGGGLTLNRMLLRACPACAMKVRNRQAEENRAER